jgi:molybdopterin adenylyltransferase
VSGIPSPEGHSHSEHGYERGAEGQSNSEHSRGESGQRGRGHGAATTAAAIVAAVVTASDSGFAGTRRDTSGDVLEELLRELGAASVARSMVPDDADAIVAELRRLADETSVNLVLTTGGTGFTSRDVTPEATRAVIDREAPGIAEAMRFVSLQQTPRAMLSRGVSGLRGRTLIINMPGSPRACREQFEVIREALPHGIEKLLDSGGDCARPDEPPLH